MANTTQIIWATPSGLINKIQEGELFSYTLEANTSNIITTYSIISGKLPAGLSLIGTGNIIGVQQGTIQGIPSTVNKEQTSTFTVRIKSIDGQIADRTFSLTVFGALPSIPKTYLGNIATSNIGIFPDGSWISANIVAINPNNPPIGNVNYQIVSGNLPSGLTLANSGIISGFANPNILLIEDAGWDDEPLDTTGFDFAPSNISANFSIDVRVSTQHLPVVTTYNMSIERLDYFNNSNANLSLPYYHAPIFTDATYTTTNLPVLQLGSTTSDATYVYKVNTYDFESDPTGYQIITGNSAPYILPSNLNINSNTGWLEGYISEDQSSSQPYQFIIRAFKGSTENNVYFGNTIFNVNNFTFTGLANGSISANTIFSNDYQSLAIANISISDLASQNIIWESVPNLGNIIIGSPCTLRINSNLSSPYIITEGSGANGVTYAQLVNTSIIFGGTGYTVNDILSIVGGTYSNVAKLIVDEIGVNGQILATTLVGIPNQKYTKLPILNNTVTGGGGNNAQFNLSFGVESVDILNGGQDYPNALIGFTSENETIPATASALLHNGSISNIIITNAGTEYQSIPNVIVSSYTLLSNIQPIAYELINGELPAGLKLLSNGMIIGRPSYQAISDNYSFTVRASSGSNYPIIVEQNIPNGNGSNLVTEEFQELTFSDMEFTITLDATSGQIPKTNLSLEFLLDENDNNYLQSLIQNVNLVPNSSIYRTDDFYFGRCENYRMLIAYGINPTVDAQMVAGLAKFHHNKKYLLTGLNWAQSIDSKGNVDYEVIYITAKDEFTTNNGNTFTGTFIGKTTTHPITVDTTQFTSDDIIRDADNVSMATLFPATYPNMMQQIKNSISDFENSLLPTWMTSIQPNGQILGAIQAIPLIYLNPGQGQKALYNINQYISQTGIGLNSVNAITDRYVWDKSLIINWDTANSTWISNSIDSFTELDEGSQYLEFRYRDFMATQILGEEF